MHERRKNKDRGWKRRKVIFKGTKGGGKLNFTFSKKSLKKKKKSPRKFFLRVINHLTSLKVAIGTCLFNFIYLLSKDKSFIRWNIKRLKPLHFPFHFRSTQLTFSFSSFFSYSKKKKKERNNNEREGKEGEE